MPTDLRDALLLQYHWLSASGFTRPRQHHPHRAVVVDNAELVAHEDGAEGAAAPLAVPLGDVDGELVLYDDDAAREELAVIRADYVVGDDENINLYTRILGGAWTMREMGVAADAVSCYARAWCLPWCASYGWPTSSRYGFVRYGRDEAHQLAREWLRRAEYFYNLFVVAGYDEHFQYTVVHCTEYEENLDFIVFIIITA